MMNIPKKTITSCVIFALLLNLICPHGVTGITIKEEEEMAREFMRYITAQFEIVDDPVIVNYINRIGNKILSKFPSQPFAYRFYVVKEDVYNAFATAAGHIFIYTGLIAAMDSENELAGILSHEISHVFCRHISQKIERSKMINMATLAGVAAGLLIGAAGGGQAASAVTMGSMAAGQSAALAFSREDEIQADQVGLDYLYEAGYTGEGLITVLNKIRDKQWFGAGQVPSYLMTHPAVEDRLAYIDTLLAGNEDKKKFVSRGNSAEFDLVRARIIALYTNESIALKKFESEVRTKPEDAMANYGYGLVLARSGNREAAIDALKNSLSIEAFNASTLSALGRVYFMDRKYQDALSTLHGALSLNPVDPEALFFLGRTLMELGRPAEAQSAFESLKNEGVATKQVYYFLGKSYGEQGKLAEAYYSLGIYYYLKRDFGNARIHFTQALEKSQESEQRKEIEKRLKEIKDIEAALIQQKRQ
jgi:predicted Zn-dependent protease